MLLFAIKYKFVMLCLNTTINFLTTSWPSIYCMTPFKSFTNCKNFPRSLNGELGSALHLVYKFNKQIARCSNSHIKILNLFEFPHVSK